MLYLVILVGVSILCFTSYFFGKLLKDSLSMKYSNNLNLPLGFFAMLGIGNFVSYPVVNFRFEQIYLYIVYLFLFLLSIIYFIFLALKRKIGKINVYFFVLLFVYVALMVWISSQRALGEESFDTVHYLAYVLEGASGSYFNQFDVDYGTTGRTLYVLDDFQSYYHFLSMFFSFISSWLNNLKLDIYPIVSPIIIWIFSVFYYIVNFSMVYSVIEYLNIKSRLLKISLGAFILLFIGNFYYYNIFAFYGNSFRTIIVSVMMFIVYRSLEESKNQVAYAFVLMLLSSALISTSASGFFIGFILLFGYVSVHLKNLEFGNHYAPIVMFLSLPTLLYSIFYFQKYINIAILVAFIAYSILFIFNYYIRKHNKLFVKFFKVVTWYMVPIGIFIYSLFLLFKSYQPITLFFNDNKVGDMVWNYFDFVTPLNVVVNSLYFISFFSYIFFSKSRFKFVFISIILTFINPISILSVHRFLAGLIFYRSYEAIFNHFSIILIFYTLFGMISYQHVKKCLKIMFSILTMVISIYQMNFYYTWLFLPTDNFNILYKLQNSQVEAFEFLNTKIILEGYTRARVVSQIPTIKGFVPNIEVPIAYNYYRNLDRYIDTNKAPSDLHNLFIKRDYFDQKIFDTPPDYANTCIYLIQYMPDFVLLDKNQSYFEDGTYKFLYHRVRGCATQIFENEHYMIYQFYW